MLWATILLALVAFFIVRGLQEKEQADRDADILYKISALQDSFGLRVRGFLVSTAAGQVLDRKKNCIKDHIARRARQCRTEVIHPDDIPDFAEWLTSKVPGL